uniref:Peptidase S1 domain-containing protein n=1 Tax=Electrophorus electricus TaxID=8005 RepID=A0AAY5EXZ3_ELEEL
MENRLCYMLMMMLSKCIFTVLACCGVAPLNSRIAGGDNALGLHWDKAHICGGSLISNSNIRPPNILSSTYNWTFYLGRQNQYMSLMNPNEYDLFLNNDINNDIALIQLTEPVTFTEYISPIYLASCDSTFYTGTSCWSTGWGNTRFGESLQFPWTLQEVKIKVVENKMCNCQFKTFTLGLINITSAMICAGEAEAGACHGDSGGTLQCKQGSVWVLAGVTSFGLPCATGSAPDVYAQVSEFHSWILENINRSEVGFVTVSSDDTNECYECNGEEKVEGKFYVALSLIGLQNLLHIIYLLFIFYLLFFYL